MIKIISLILISINLINAQSDIISHDSLKAGKVYDFDFLWKYQKGNNPEWAKTEFMTPDGMKSTPLFPLR